MPLSRSSQLSRQHVVVALAIGTIALLMVGVQPILLGALFEAGHVSMDGLGIVATVEIVCLGLGVVLGDAVVPLDRLRSVTALAALFAATSDIASVFAPGELEIDATRASAGLFEGLLVWTTTSVIVRSADPSRIAGIFFAVQTLAQVGLGVVMAQTVIPQHGWKGGFMALALTATVPVAMARWLPAELAPLETRLDAGFRWSSRAMRTLLIVFLQLAAAVSLWAYLEPLSLSVGFDSKSAQLLISGVLLMQVAGAATAAVVVRFLAVGPMLFTGTMAMASCSALIYQLPSGSVWQFGVACCMFGFTWLFLAPFQVSLALRVDDSGRVATLIPAMQLLGSAFGPFVASWFSEGPGQSRVPLVSVAFAILAAGLLLSLRPPTFPPRQDPA